MSAAHDFFQALNSPSTDEHMSDDTNAAALQKLLTRRFLANIREPVILYPRRNKPD